MSAKKRLKYFLKAVYALANSALGTIPYVVSAVNNFDANIINFLGLFVSIKNILTNSKDIYLYYGAKKNDTKIMLYTNWVLIGLYVLYFVAYAILFALGKANNVLVRLSYLAFLPIKDYITTIMYLVMLRRCTKEIESSKK